MIQKIKHTLATRWKLLVVIFLLAPGVLVLLFIYPPVNSEGKVDSAAVAAWVQGVGTVLAVLAAAWIARDQFDWQQRAEDQRRLNERLVELVVVVETLCELDTLIDGCRAALLRGSDVFNAFYAADGQLDLEAFEGLVKLLGEVPLSAAHGPALHLQLHKAKAFAEAARQQAGYLRGVLHGLEHGYAYEGAADNLRKNGDGLKVALDAFRKVAEGLRQHEVTFRCAT